MFTLRNELYYYYHHHHHHHHHLPTYDAASTPVSCFFPSSESSFHANMDSVFFLGQEDRSSFLHTMMQFFGSTYICLWSYDNQSNLSQTLFNFLRYMDGLYNQPGSSSSGNLAELRFNEYRQSVFIVDHNNRFIPGHALVNNIPYLELKSDDLLQFARVEVQRQFYQAAGIKTAVFMGCNAGEIELGFSDPSQVNIEKEMRNWFPDDFCRQLMLMKNSQEQQNKPASSSSSLRSLSYDSPEYPPPPNFLDQQEPIVDQHLAAGAGTLKPSPSIFTTATCPNPASSLLINQIRSPQIPSIQSEDDAMAKAILAVICSNNNNNNNNPNITINSNNSSNTFHFQPQQNFPISTTTSTTRDSAFKWYGSSSSSSSKLGQKSSTQFRRQNMLKKSIAFLRSIHAMRSQEHNNVQNTSRTSTTQLHHMISERKRREKLNESFQALRSLLPPNTKKDKASVLTGTTEYLSTLKAEIEELSKRNAILEAQILPKKKGGGGGETEIGVTEVSELATTSSSSSSSSTGARLIDLHVTRLGQINISDLLVSLLDFLKTSSDHRNQISLMSVEANTTLDESSNSLNRIVFRLKIEGEWDESAFQEGVRRIVNNQMQQ